MGIITLILLLRGLREVHCEGCILAWDGVAGRTNGRSFRAAKTHPLSWSVFNIPRVLALGVDTERSLSALGDISKAHARGKHVGARTSHEG